jgi:hypothetical protein
VNAYQRIQKAMRDRDRDLLVQIRLRNMDGNAFWNVALDSRTMHSLDRLVAAGKIKYSKRLHGYVAKES